MSKKFNSLDDIKMRFRDSVEDDWEYMGEGVKAQDSVETPVSNWNEDEWGATEDETSEIADSILSRIREKHALKKSKDQLECDQQFGADLYKAVEQDMQLTVNPEAKPHPEMQFHPSQAPSTITISDKKFGRLVVIHTDTGEVEYGEHYTPNLASDAFWKAVGHNRPSVLNAEIDELKSTIKSLRFSYKHLKELNGEQAAADSRIIVGEMITNIKRKIPEIVEPFIFEPNNALTRRSVRAVLDNFLSDFQSRRLISTFRVVCDESNNSPETIASNVLQAEVAFEIQTGGETVHIPVRITPHDRIEREMEIACSVDIVNEIDQEVIANLIAADKKNAYDEEYVNASSYDDAMKVI